MVSARQQYFGTFSSNILFYIMIYWTQKLLEWVNLSINLISQVARLSTRSCQMSGKFKVFLLYNPLVITAYKVSKVMLYYEFVIYDEYDDIFNLLIVFINCTFPLNSGYTFNFKSQLAVYLNGIWKYYFIEGLSL